MKNTVDKYLDNLNEETTDFKMAFKVMDNKLYNSMRDAYYGVGDNLDGLVKFLYKAKKDDKIFTQEYVNAAAALKAFEKIDMGSAL